MRFPHNPTWKDLPMHTARALSAALLATTLAFPAFAINICQADKLSCATTMPVGGYCECKAHGEVHGGTAVPPHAPHTKVNSTAGGCNDNPQAPGCR